MTLGLTATDPAPASGVTQMRFSNDGVTFSAYQPYAATAAWMLTAGDGIKTVYAQFKDADGNESAVVNDTITLALPDTTGPTVTKTTPKKNAKGVKVTTKVKVKVSEALKGSTVTKKTVFLKAKGSSDEVKAKVTYNSSKKMIVLTPNKALKKQQEVQRHGHDQGQGRGRQRVRRQARQVRRPGAEVLLHHRLSRPRTPTGGDIRPVGVLAGGVARRAPRGE